MIQQEKENLVWIAQKNLNKKVEREKAQAKMEKFLTSLNKQYKQVKKVELNARYLDLTVPIKNLKY
ncbi:MAG: hypothetical protein ACFE9M_13820 [Promethearchaeota archaeon]